MSTVLTAIWQSRKSTIEQDVIKEVLDSKIEPIWQANIYSQLANRPGADTLPLLRKLAEKIFSEPDATAPVNPQYTSWTTTKSCRCATR